ncbi:hypothetical protein PAXRUDRAFT_135050 [Paxillus rubicundulus Ve08.2h10]|uniref:Uncharacterized protein n=1 Tax=Paxillus rubicundulus Ve08.2h10 TaxID=930991 RepID=A0A0D0E7W7_9AGAM|nr:hypothetical protein PAXRUDRAFT_135050 [Paxillus rubicundulus Ve08.2h10]
MEFIDTKVQGGEAPPIAQGVSDSDDALGALEDSLAATRAQLESFRLRLEAVEADTARHEAELQRVWDSIPRGSTSKDEGEPNQTHTDPETGSTLAHEETKRELSFESGLRFDLDLRDIARSIVCIRAQNNLVWSMADPEMGTSHQCDGLRCLHYVSPISCGSHLPSALLSFEGLDLDDGFVDPDQTALVVCYSVEIPLIISASYLLFFCVFGHCSAPC